MSFNKNTPKDEFDELINSNLSKGFLKDIYVMLTSYKIPLSIVAVIISYSEDILKLRFKDSKYVENLRLGDAIVVNISDGYMVYSATSVVLFYNTEIMELKVEKVSAKKDLRKEKRFLVKFRGEVEYGEQKSLIIVKNISQSGFNFVSKVDIPLGEEVLIKIITDESLQIKALIKIIQKSTLMDNYSYGVIINNMDNNSLKNFNKCIRNLTDTLS